MKRLDFRLWEVVLILLALILLGGALTVYVTGFPLRRYLFGLPEVGRNAPVGKLTQATGSVKRELSGEAEFKGISAPETLYNEDTIVTGDQTFATVLLNDGSSLDLSPNTMIRLSFADELTFGGITRKAQVDVVSGSVTGQNTDPNLTITRAEAARPRPSNRPSQRPLALARPIQLPSPAPIPAKPSPSPSPLDPARVTRFQLQSPRKSALFPIQKITTPEQRISFDWYVQPAGQRVNLKVIQVKGEFTREIARKTISAQGFRGSHSILVKEPSIYRWLFTDRADHPLQDAPTHAGEFIVPEEVVGAVDVLEPLVGGEPFSSNQVTQRRIKRFDITLRWKPVESVDSYEVILSNSPSLSPSLIRKFVKGTSYQFNKDKLYQGTLYYKIRAPHSNGFVGTSLLKTFSFEFKPPEAIEPKSGKSFSKKALAREDDSILLTWSKTHFTDAYLVEISQKSDFSQILTSKKTSENVFWLRSPKVGHYYWRVRAITKLAESKPGSTQEITVAP